MRNPQDPALSHFRKHALTHLISQVDEENPLFISKPVIVPYMTWVTMWPHFSRMTKEGPVDGF